MLLFLVRFYCEFNKKIEGLMNINLIIEYKFIMIILTKKDLKFYLLMISILIVSIAAPITLSNGKKAELQAVNAGGNLTNSGEESSNSNTLKFNDLKIIVDAGHGEPDRRSSVE